jgi:hypothetical protein
MLDNMSYCQYRNKIVNFLGSDRIALYSAGSIDGWGNQGEGYTGIPYKLIISHH